MNRTPLLTSIVTLAKIETLTPDSFSNGSDAQRHLCEIQSQFDADGSLAGMVIDDAWMAQWNASELLVRTEMLLNYVKREMEMAVSTQLDL